MFLDIKESIFTKVLFDSSFWVPFVFQEYLKDYVNCLKYQELVTDEDTLALKTALWALVGSAGLLFLHDTLICVVTAVIWASIFQFMQVRLIVETYT